MSQGTAPTRHRIGGALRIVLVLAALAAVFAAYLHPDLAMDLASRAWSCF